MPNKAALRVKALPVWVLALCLSGVAPVCAQAPDQTPEAPAASDAGDATPATTAPNEVAVPLEPEAATAPDAIGDYKPTESISEDLSVSFPVDI